MRRAAVAGDDLGDPVTAPRQPRAPKDAAVHIELDGRVGLMRGRVILGWSAARLGVEPYRVPPGDKGDLYRGMPGSSIHRLNRPRGVSLIAVAIVTAAVLLGWPAVGSAAPVARALSGSEVGAEQALVAQLAPLLGRYGRELSSLEAQTAGTDAVSPIAPFGAAIASDPEGSTPAPVAALEGAIRKLAGPARRGLSDLDTDIKHGAFTTVGGILSAARQIAGLLNPTAAQMKALKQDVKAIIRELASELPPASLAVGPGQPVGPCPRSEDPIDCWILQDDNGPTLSYWLGNANLVASIVGLIAGVGEVPSFGFDTPLTIGADVVGTGTSVAQFYVDLVRRAGYSESVVAKVVTAFMDAASVGTSIFDLGLLGDSLRLKAASEVVEKAAPTVEEIVDALHQVIPAGEQIDKGVKLVDLIAELRDAKTVLEAKTQAKTVISVLLTIITAYNGPASSWLDQLATYLAKRVRAALGSTAPAHHPTSMACQGLRASAGGGAIEQIVATGTSCVTAHAVARSHEFGTGTPYRAYGFSCTARGTSGVVGEVYHFRCTDGAARVTFTDLPT